jgi:mono/diheme cytochrome c family protein
MRRAAPSAEEAKPSMHAPRPMTTRLQRLALALTLIASSCVLTVENGHVGSPDLGSDPIAAGGRAYAARCASCHGLDARGDGPVGPALRTAPPDLTWLTERNGGTFPRDYVIAVITGTVAITAHGTREMPVWSDRVAPADGNGAGAAASVYLRRTVEALADYLASIQRRWSAATRSS